MKILAAFSSLRIKAGFILRGYECAIGSNSWGVVWAMPAKAPYPGEDGGPIKNGGFNKPDGALEDVMDVVEGDGSPRSYLCASILSRELDEFGARWHGQNWVTHTILTANPWKSGIPARHRSRFPGPSPDPNRWEWLETEPKDWRPSVTVSHDSVTVTFFTYSPLGQEAIYRHVDCFVSGSYHFSTERTVIARGPQYMVF